MSQLFQSYHPYDHKLGETQRVLITERSHDGVHLVGHNKFYDQVRPVLHQWARDNTPFFKFPGAGTSGRGTDGSNCRG